MFFLLTILWFAWEAKSILFWLYLWQLKDYHIARFADHFRTEKGKVLIFDASRIIKLVLLASFLVFSDLFVYLFYALFFVYLAEFAFFLSAILNSRAKRPVITKKTSFLLVILFALLVLFLLFVNRFDELFHPALFLVFDILTPAIVSVIILLFQPFFVLLRNGTLKKAKLQLEKTKGLNKLKVIAITGSYGKTSTKEFLATILSKKYKVLKTKEHQNSEIGIASCILRDLRPSHQVFIAEVGAYDKGKVKEVCNVLNPDIGIVTGVNEQHLALFGSMENLLSGEGGRELAEALPQGSLLVVNGDNKYCLELYRNARENLNKKIYTLDGKAVDSDIWASEAEVFQDHVSFVVSDRVREIMHFDVKVLGKQNVQNILGAILVAKELGMGLGDISDACKDIMPAQAGIVLLQTKHGINIIDSSYSANPDGVIADLEYLSVFPPKRMVVMPCLIELGSKSSEIHKKIGKKAAEFCDLAVITSKDKFAEFKMGAMEAGMAEKNIILCDRPRDIYSIITLNCRVGDAVLLEGRVPAELIKLLQQ